MVSCFINNDMYVCTTVCKINFSGAISFKESVTYSKMKGISDHHSNELFLNDHG